MVKKSVKIVSKLLVLDIYICCCLLFQTRAEASQSRQRGHDDKHQVEEVLKLLPEEL